MTSWRVSGTNDNLKWNKTSLNTQFACRHISVTRGVSINASTDIHFTVFCLQVKKKNYPGVLQWEKMTNKWIIKAMWVGHQTVIDTARETQETYTGFYGWSWKHSCNKRFWLRCFLLPKNWHWRIWGGGGERGAFQSNLDSRDFRRAVGRPARKETNTAAIFVWLKGLLYSYLGQQLRKSGTRVKVPRHVSYISLFTIPCDQQTTNKKLFTFSKLTRKVPLHIQTRHPLFWKQK